MNGVGILVVFGVVLISMILHEMAHAYTAYLLGDHTAKDEGRLSPNPLVHIDPWMSIVVPLLLYISGGVVFGGAKPVPINTRNLKGGAWGMALVGLVGPLTNLLLALVSFLIGHFTGMLYAGGIGGLIFSQMVFANLGFFVFNMIPVPPLDGSRVLYAVMPDFVRSFMEQMERGGGLLTVVILVVFMGSYLSQFMTSVIFSIMNFFLMLVGA